MTNVGSNPIGSFSWNRSSRLSPHARVLSRLPSGVSIGSSNSRCQPLSGTGALLHNLNTRWLPDPEGSLWRCECFGLAQSTHSPVRTASTFGYLMKAVWIALVIRLSTAWSDILSQPCCCTDRERRAASPPGRPCQMLPLASVAQAHASKIEQCWS